jgi:hypothetical protein
MKRFTTIVVGVVVLALGATTYAAVIRPSAARWTSTKRPMISVTAQVTGSLYPGSRRPVKLRIKNLLGRKVKLLGVAVKVGKPGGGCPTWAISGSRVAVRATLGLGTTHTVWASLRMVPSSPDACQGAQIPLSFTVTLDGPP